MFGCLTGDWVGVFWVPEADADAVFGQVGADALADGSGLREGEGWQGGDEDDGFGSLGEGLEDLGGEAGTGEEEGGVVGVFHELGEHEGGELVGLIAGGDADYGEALAGGAVGWDGDDAGGGGGAVVGEFGDELADAEEEEVGMDFVECAVVTVLLGEREGGQEEGVVEFDEGLAGEESVGDGVGLLLVHGEEALVEVGIGGERGVGAEKGVEKGHLRDMAAEDDHADGERRGEDETGPAPEQRPEDGHGEQGE